jgi:hypothetical protein
MSTRALPGTAILAAGIGMGFAGDHLLWESAGPGLNVFLLFLGLAASVWIVTRSGDSPLSREASLWIGTGLLCGVGLLWRGSGLVRVLSFLAACTAFALPAFDAGRAWIRRSGILDVVAAVAGAGLHAAFGSVRLMNRGHWAAVGESTGGGAAREWARTAVVGALLATVPLTVFGALFLSADAVFATLVGDFVRIDLQAFASHLVLIAVLSWLACGYLVGVSAGTKLEGTHRLRPGLPKFGIAEVATALALVDVLFLSFVVVQFRYLFGGGSWVEVTPGLTYAAYARAGFFQLVAAVALAIPWLLAAHALLDGRGLKARSVFSALAGVHLLLLVVIVASAVQRMQAYQAAYGLTEERVAATAVLAWLTGVVVWFGATVLSGRRHRFVFGGLVTAYLLVGALHLMDPAGLVARHNLERREELGGVDVAYLTAVGSDAVPFLLDSLGELSPYDQCVVASRLLRAWGPERPWDWRSFNWSDSRARSAVHEDLEALRAVVGRPSCTAGQGGKSDLAADARRPHVG